ncbi:MAG: hypothetical protein WB610_06505, partial [Rhodomicrobium sp.]
GRHDHHQHEGKYENQRESLKPSVTRPAGPANIGVVEKIELPEVSMKYITTGIPKIITASL